MKNVLNIMAVILFTSLSHAELPDVSEVLRNLEEAIRLDSSQEAQLTIKDFDTRKLEMFILLKIKSTHGAEVAESIQNVTSVQGAYIAYGDNVACQLADNFEISQSCPEEEADPLTGACGRPLDLLSIFTTPVCIKRTK